MTTHLRPTTRRSARRPARALAPAALATGLLVAGLVHPVGASAAAGGTVYGSTLQFQKGERMQDTLARVEKVDGHLGAVRVFQTVPKPAVFASLEDRAGIVSFKLPPAQVLAGTYDAQFKAFFAAAPKGRTTWWSYYHEADVAYQHKQLTDLQQYRDAYTRVAKLARAAQNPLLKNTVVLVGYTANPKSGLTVKQFMPAPGLTDLISWDNYNGWFQRNDQGYGDPTNMLRLDKEAAAAVGLPYGVAEFGSQLGGPAGGPIDYQGRADWITKFCQVAQSTGAVFVNYFDYATPGGATYSLSDVPSQIAYHDVVSDQDAF